MKTRCVQNIYEIHMASKLRRFFHLNTIWLPWKSRADREKETDQIKYKRNIWQMFEILIWSIFGLITASFQPTQKITINRLNATFEISALTSVTLAKILLFCRCLLISIFSKKNLSIFFRSKNKLEDLNYITIIPICCQF